MSILILITIITLMFSAFFSGVEIAFVSANKLKLEIDKTSGKFPSNIITYFSKSESDFITTMLVGNNISLVVYGIVMTKILTPKFAIYINSDIILLLIQTIITTIIVLITAEFLPKVIFRIYSNQILKIFSIPILICFIVLRPIALLFIKLSNSILRVFLKQKTINNKSVFNKIDLDEYLNNLQTDAKQDDTRVDVEMLQNALELSSKKVRECMIPRTEIIALDMQSSIYTLQENFIKTKLSKILIFKHTIDNIIGYVHSSDLFNNPQHIKSILLPIPIVPESMLLIELLNIFIEENKGIALVVDEFGGTSGIITIEDVTEEIVGEIIDEHDSEEIIDQKINHNEFLFAARLDVSMVNKKYNLNLPESEEYETLAGLILSKSEQIPNKGEILEIDDCIITIKEADDRSIHTIHLSHN